MQAIESKTFNRREARQAKRDAKAQAAAKPVADIALTVAKDGQVVDAKPVEETTPTVEPPATPVAAVVVATSSKAPNSVAILLQAPAECPLTFKLANGNTFTVAEALVGSYRTKTGWRTFVTLYSAKYKKGVTRTGTRGETTTEPSLAAARAKVEAMAKTLIAKGFVRPVAKPLGLVAQPDAFTMETLPDPVKA